MRHLVLVFFMLFASSAQAFSVCAMMPEVVQNGLIKWCGTFAFQSSLKQEDLEKVKQILIQTDEVDVNVYANGTTALHLATIDKDVKLLDLLLSKENLNIFLQDDEGLTAAHYAVLTEDYPFIKVFFSKHNGFIDSKDSKGRNPVVYANALLKQAKNNLQRDNLRDIAIYLKFVQ